MKKLFIITILIGIVSQFTYAQNFDKTKLDNYFDVLETNNKFMGSVAVSENGEIIYTKSVGFADFENKTEADENTKYRIGSISKTFTAVLVLKAVEQDKLDLSQTLDEFYPSIENSDEITIKYLLNHRSGIHNFTADQDYLSWHTRPKTESEMLSLIAEGGSDFEPNSRAQYSNSNYILLSFILQKLFKTSYGELLNNQITEPIGLDNTYLGEKINTADKESKSYTYMNTWTVENETDMSIPLGAGGIVSTPIDLVKFSDALFTGKLISDNSLELMKTVENQFGLGLVQIPFYDKTGYGHTGGIDGFSSVFSYFSDGNISYALTSNGTNYNNNNISIAVLSAVFDKPYEIPEFTTYEVGLEDLERYLGVYSSVEFPLNITISMNNETLVAQATGQSAFPLEATAEHKFEFKQADVVLEFKPETQSMILKQGGGEFTFTKD
ncbi:serine hydrolase domain-containing protein [Psychroflexus aestuariivivens]|uniref:serine hydrolase domain-containing protein n=1 Tax=Psychroflexus aestuariivivens TaxID=1795040 RepID=UPI000FDB91F3|nr:serine hydrolase domain-containing protein [Psychroflexus aestuariivivens]